MTVQTLMAPEPHFKPGYTGYLEKRNYYIGGSLGKRSHTSLEARRKESPKMDLFVHGKAVSNPKNGRPQSAIIPNTPPAGYTGYVPKSHGNDGIGERYAVRALNGFRSQETHNKRTNHKMTNIRANEIQQLQQRLQNEPNKISRSQSAHPMSHPHLNAPQAPSNTQKSYFMSQTDPERYHKSGYTGYLPRSRDFYAAGLSTVSTSALSRMDAELHSGRYCPFPRQGLKPHERPQTDSRITQGMGMKPGYTGYIPGSRYEFAKTYGKITFQTFNSDH